MTSATQNSYNPAAKKVYIVNYNFIDGAFVEVLSGQPGLFWVEFIDQDTQKVLQSAVIRQNQSITSDIKYFVNFHVKVTNLATNKVIFEHYYSAKGQRVYIMFDTPALGDTIAWLAHIDTFYKLHACEIVVTTFHNDLFEKNYPNFKFVQRYVDVTRVYAMYKLGLYYDNEDHGYPGDIDIMHHREDFRDDSIAKIGADILGVPFIPTKPNIVINKIKNVYGKYVCIAPHASGLTKYWHYPGGWQAIVDYLNEQGYKVLMITYEKHGIEEYDQKIGGKLRGVIDKTGNNLLSERARDIANADLFIGVATGLSWLAWAIGCKVVMISGFSQPESEFTDCERIFTPKPATTCNGCFVKARLDKVRSEGCPNHEGTERMYECSKTITPKAVIAGIKRQLGLGRVEQLKKYTRALRRG